MYRFVYSLILFLIYPLYFLVSIFHPKAKVFRTTRSHGFTSLQLWLAKNKNSKAPIIWLHGSSVGEVDQALGLLHVLKKKHTKAHIILSTFSLSSKLKNIEGIDLYFYLPLDFTINWNKLFKSKAPDLFITMTWDIFPNLLHVLSKKKTKTYLCSASISDNNWRLRPLSQKLLRPVYSGLTGIGCVNKSNQERYQRLCYEKNKVHVTGDSRFDTIINKIKNTPLKKEHIDWWKSFKKTRDVVWILASTYSECESLILPSLPSLLEEFSHLKVAIFPHKINEERIDQVQRQLNQYNISHQKFTDTTIYPNTRVVIMNIMGILALSYNYSNFCYVGGGFASRVHNTAEPAALQNPILTGPNIDWSGIALELEEIEILTRCSSQQEIVGQARSLLLNKKHCTSIGKKATDHLHNNTGSSLLFYTTFLEQELVQKA